MATKELESRTERTRADDLLIKTARLQTNNAFTTSPCEWKWSAISRSHILAHDTREHLLSFALQPRVLLFWWICCVGLVLVPSCLVFLCQQTATDVSEVCVLIAGGTGTISPGIKGRLMTAPYLAPALPSCLTYYQSLSTLNTPLISNLSFTTGIIYDSHHRTLEAGLNADDGLILHMCRRQQAFLTALVYSLYIQKKTDYHSILFLVVKMHSVPRLTNATRTQQ